MLLSTFSLVEMVQLRKQRGGLARRKVGRRVGQNGNGLNGLNNFNGNGFNGDESLQDLAQDLGVDPLPETLSIEEATQRAGLEDIIIGTDEDGSGVVLAEGGDGSVVAFVEGEGAEPEPTPDVCEFPEQDLRLRRRVNITNTVPQILQVDTDICGNAIGYTEEMTRTLRAGPWEPISGMQGLVNQFVDVNGVIQAQDVNPFGSVVAANAQGFNTLPRNGIQYSIESQQVVGRGKRRTAQKRVPTTNANAQFGASLLRKFRSA